MNKMRVVCWVLILLLQASCANSDEQFRFTDQEGLETVAILETSSGPITIQFFLDKAPEHVRNFLQHCGSGFYDKTYFHRVAPNFMIQGGDPTTKDDDPSNDGLGGYSYKGPGTTLEPEFNDVKHVPGIVSMARSSEPDSAGSQFFIMVGEFPSLDGQYTAFGRVVDGMEAVRQISEEPGIPIPEAGGYRPSQPQYIRRCRVENRPEEEVEELARETASLRD